MRLTIVTLLLNLVFAKDYCKLCENGSHTMCQYKEGPADKCINYTDISLSPGEKMYILDIHNDIRNHVASGQETRGALGNQPAAADMFLLEWDEELAMIAQRWADQCISVNTTMQNDLCRRTEQFDVGQNIVTIITNTAELPEISILILKWYKQIINIIPSDIDDFVGALRGKNHIGQYTQLVWAKTKFVGCAATAFKESVSDTQFYVRFVCNYGPAGNEIGESVYQRGEPCSKCPHKACDRLRTNLCAGMYKHLNIKNEKNVIFKKHRGRATTLSNLIDTEDPKFFKFFNPWFVNKSTSQEEIQTSGTTLNSSISTDSQQDFEGTLMMNNDNSTDNIYTSSDKELLNNSSLIASICAEMENCSNESFEATTSEYYNFTSSVIMDDEKHFVDRNFSVNWYKDNYLKNLTIVSRIQLVMNNFLLENIFPDVTVIPDDYNDTLLIDLTKTVCDRETKLENGIFIIQECKDESAKSKKHYKNFPTRRKTKTATFDGNDVILPGNRHFTRAKGVWYKGHCRCTRFIRSHTTKLSITYTLYLPSLFACYISIKKNFYSSVLFYILI